jgi:1,4-dihydroxy-2-naphthoyl-CoA hydrolase
MYEFRTTVGMHHTDAGGVVFFANFFILAHSCYEAWLAETISIAAIIEDKQMIMPMVHAEADYRKPLKLSDKVRIELTPGETTRTTFTLNYKIYNTTNQLTAEIKTIHACIAIEKNRPTRLPDFLKEMIEKI